LNDSGLLSFSDWFWNLYEFTDTSQFWDRGITMSKQRSFWLHNTVESVAAQKISRKHYLSLLQADGLLIFLIRNVRYNILLRKYAYSSELLRLCSAGPMHVTNTALRRFVLLDFFDKIGAKYFSYNYIFFKKDNFKKYSKIKPNFPVYKGSDLFLSGSLDLSGVSAENILESLFVYKDYTKLDTFLGDSINNKINLFFLFDLYVIQLVEVYKIITILFLNISLKN